MSYFRSYFKKNNTLIKGSTINTAKNPVTEIFYGNGLSRFVFLIDLDPLKELILSGRKIINTDTRHILNLTNTIIGDSDLIGEQRMNGNSRATSFDLIIFKVPERWDEGVGFDYLETDYDSKTGNKTNCNRPSNWYRRTTADTWTVNGVYNEPEILQTVHFDNGNENLTADITDYINGIIYGSVEDYGLGVAFDLTHERIKDVQNNSVSFFSMYTQTFFEPYLETIFNDRISDSRQQFVVGREEKLYLILHDGAVFHDLDELPSVDVAKENGNIVRRVTASKVSKGIYSAEFTLDDYTINGRKIYTDTWTGLKIGGNMIPDITQTFVPKQFFDTLMTDSTPKDFSFRVVGLKHKEKIKRGEVRKVSLHYHNIDKREIKPFEKVYYRMYIMEGKTNVTVHDWTQMNRSDDNHFFLDTSFYIPREYSIEFKIEYGNEVKHYRDTIDFEIISER